MFQRAITNKPLTPKERAALTAIKNLMIGMVGTTFLALAMILLAGQEIPCSLLQGTAMTIFYTVVQMVRKYLAALGDIDLAELLQIAEGVSSHRRDPRYSLLPPEIETK